MILSRASIIEHLANTLQGRQAVRAAWLAGSAAFNRLDELSDIDLMLLVEDGAVEAVIEVLDRAIEELGGSTQRFRVPQPTFHGHEQVFYQLSNAPPTLLVDVLVMALSKPGRFLERERHGTPIVLFDRDGLAVATPLDRAEHEQKIRTRLAALRAKFPLFQVFVTKAVARGNAPEAAHFYLNFTLVPLVELLRIRHCPDRFDYGLRYIHADLPADVAELVARLAIPGSLQELGRAQREAAAMFEHISADAALARYA
jgi:predicted nucleotidyltransferase